MASKVINPAGRTAKRVLIGGGSGFVGQAVAAHLQHHGYSVSSISRDSSRPNSIDWNKVKSNGINGFDAVIQLSGANIIDKPWSEKRKQELLESRVGTTKTLVEAIQKSSDPPAVFISGSAVGIYPTSTNEEFTEDSKAVADNFAGKLVHEWEEASQPLEKSEKTRRVVTRFGVVVGNGGMIAKMYLPFRFWVGGKIGSGEQYMPWVHVKDVARLHQFVIEHPEVRGVLNATAPEIITNAQLTHTLGKVLQVPTIVPAPAIGIKTFFGERAFLLLEGQKVVPKRTLETGFSFEFPNLEGALRDAIQERQGKR
eukprot:Phypoly_transcript_11699.p1 GENE.Phypoly_transcript_11699~~Phypoly_transcript_11699.p1  ORF type:complete len:312 (+),score=48.79 Phypoly_transcript_11699:186-1121(+)